MSMFNLVTGTVVGSDGYRIQCRHAGQAYTILWGPPIVFTTPNLADTRNVTLLLVQGKHVDLEDEGGDVPAYVEMRLRLVHDPVGQAIMFELFIRLFYLFVLGVRPDCVAQPRGPKGFQVPDEWCTDGVAASVLVFGAYGPLLAARGEVEASGRGSLHPHIEAWAVCQHLRDYVHELMKDMKTFKQRLRRWIREWVNAMNSMHHSSVANFPKLFCDTHVPGDLPAVTPEIAGRTRMDGGMDTIPGHHPKQRARILPDGVEPQNLGPDDPYLPEGERSAPPPSKATDSEVAVPTSDEACPPPPPVHSHAPRRSKVTLRGSTCTSFPKFRRQQVVFAASYQAHHNTIELCKDCWLQEYVRDSRLVQNRTMLHKCGPSCYKYSKDGTRICRHQVYHLTSFEPDTAEKPKRIRREGHALNNVIRITEDDSQGQRGRVELIREHPTETTTNYAGAVCMRCNLDAQTLVRVLPTSVLDSGPLPTIGSKPHWAGMNAAVPDGSPTNLVLPLSDSDSEGNASEDRDLKDLTEEVEREIGALFQDAHNAGFYINEYTTKVNVLGDKLLQGLRKATEKQRDQMEAAALEESDKKVTKAQQALQMLRKMVHLIARLQLKSGAEMAFPILFGHMSFATHRTWEMNVRRPVALLWKSWEAHHGKSLQQLRQSATFRHTLNMYLPQERDLKLPPDWLVLEMPPDTVDTAPKAVYLSPRGARFESYDAALHFIATANPHVTFDPTTTTLDGDSDQLPQSGQPEMALTSASYFDDWLHRGSGNLLSDLPWYVYSMWVYRTERMKPQDPRTGLYLDVDFAPHYKLAGGYVQRVSLALRVPQPEGMTLPTALQDPNGNAMYKSLLFRPFHAIPMDTSTGETPDAYLCLHKAENDGEVANPYMTFSTQWHRYWRKVVIPNADRASQKLKNRLEWESFWETKEVFVHLLELSTKGPFADASLTLEAARAAAFAHDLVNDRVTVQEYACLVVHRSAKKYEGFRLLCLIHLFIIIQS